MITYIDFDGQVWAYLLLNCSPVACAGAVQVGGWRGGGGLSPEMDNF